MSTSPGSGAHPGSSLPDHAPCPFCGGTETRLLSPFAGQLTVAQYWCNHCRTGFEYIKWEPASARDYSEL
jgi:hypothetical protein